MSPELVNLLCIFICLIPTIVLWVEYAKSGDDNNIDEIKATITDIDTSTLYDCNEFSKEKIGITFHYSYFYSNNNYTGKYETCETNDGIKTQLKIHEIGSNITIFILKENPSESSVIRKDLMNQIMLIFGIICTISTCILLWFISCCFDTSTIGSTVKSEIESYFIEKTKEVINNKI